MGINDSNAQFLEDSIRGATGQKDLSKPCPPTTELFNALVNNSGPGIQWLEDSFGLKLDTVSRLGGHTYERTHRSKSGGKFPGMMITYALMEALEQKAASHPDKARVICRATATNLLTNPDGSVAGIEFEQGGKTYKEYGSVVLASGGFGRFNFHARFCQS
jgi:succinate dehydrogenase/fumarate reductase flavoprotein subunit